MPYNQLDRYLRFWNVNKRTFYQAFGEEFIIKKEISLTKTLGDGANEMRRKLGKYYAAPIIRTFVNYYQSVIQNIMDHYMYDDEIEEFVEIVSGISHTCSTGTCENYPALYIIKDGSVKNAYRGAVTVDELKSALSALGVN
jgi:predicted hydrocarbon binding protein